MYWIVYSASMKRTNVPVTQFDDLASAIAAAERLARVDPTVVWYVLKTVHRVQVTVPVVLDTAAV